MVLHFQFKQILLVLLKTIYLTQAIFVQEIFKQLEPEQNITGTVVAELKKVTKIECSRLSVITTYAGVTFCSVHYFQIP